MPRLFVCYGGTFDPVHNGHLAIARAVRDALATQVHLLPAADPPHKGPTHADAKQRAAMLELAVDEESGLHVDRRELDRDGPSYTIDTLHELRAELGPDAPIAWMIGSDSLLELDTWKHWRQLFDYAHILAVQRPGSLTDGDSIERRAPAVYAEITPRQCRASQLHGAAAGGFAVFPLVEQRQESSTELRRRIRAGEPWRDWVPPAVADYIDRRGLYRDRGVHAPPL
ncbi:nicotinate-nucleotide adenylyltransferase [Lysobacter sp. CFH 32150]|uniref:nicotinate-nucleotide adenylyltransferase n=1 Tax=Lysobacter sp. CFH 32150 TaxID=2927128 RepID=UPI001FA71E94|nr:nicotinate-nucleotide adenylyltransferase [Lysobacter sp. CFH 32150]MCI4566871.1 nicotinate-nucleotide adenylyltransferase [Lysobacter sp. CFH 32150]